MSKSSQSREAAKVIVTPLFAWTSAVLKGGEMVLDSVAAAARNVRVAVLDTEAPSRRHASRKAKRSRRRRS